MPGYPRRYTGYLYATKAGGLRFSKRPGRVNADEVRVGITLEVPTSYFTEQHPAVTLTIPDPPEAPGVGVQWSDLTPADQAALSGDDAGKQRQSHPNDHDFEPRR